MSESEESESTISLSWSDDIEDVLKSILYNTSILLKEHKKNFIYYQDLLKWYKIPVIIIASINSVFSVGLSAFIEQKYVSTINCLLSLICASISSVELYLNIGKNVETELEAYRGYQILGVKISSTLKLNSCNRETHGHQFLNSCLVEYNQLFENSLVLVLCIDDKLLKINSVVTPIPKNKPSIIMNSIFSQSKNLDESSSALDNVF